MNQSTVQQPEIRTTCGRCGAGSTLGSLFTTLSHRGKMVPHCPACAQAHRVTQMRWASVWVPVLLGMAATFLVLSGGHQGWVFLNGALVLVFWWLSILPHELAHAGAALALRLRVHGVVVGSGPILLHGMAGDVPLQWRTYPFRGATYVQITRDRSYRWRRFLMVAAGPASHALMIWAVLSWAPDRAFAPGIDGGPAPWTAFIVANLLMLVGNLWPHVDKPSGTPTDGKQMLDFLLRRRTASDDFPGSSAVTEVMLMMEARQWGVANKVLCDALRSHPADPLLRMTRTALLSRLGRPREAIGLVRRMLAEGIENKYVEALVLNNGAWALCLLGDAQHAQEAIVYARRSTGALEWMAAAKATEGLVQALFGDLEIARRVFEDDRLRLQLRADAAVWACSRAIVQARLGNMALAHDCLRAVQDTDPHEYLLLQAKAFVERHDPAVEKSSVDLSAAHEGKRSSLRA